MSTEVVWTDPDGPAGLEPAAAARALIRTRTDLEELSGRMVRVEGVWDGQSLGDPLSVQSEDGRTPGPTRRPPRFPGEYGPGDSTPADEALANEALALLSASGDVLWQLASSHLGSVITVHQDAGERARRALSRLGSASVRLIVSEWTRNDYARVEELAISSAEEGLLISAGRHLTEAGQVRCDVTVHHVSPSMAQALREVPSGLLDLRVHIAPLPD